MPDKILILHENPPISYLNALNEVDVEFDCKIAPRSFANYKGLLLIGGEDVLPCFYDGKIPSDDVNFIRDTLEFNALKYFYSNHLPVLGICRGLQVINVFFGGTLKFVYNHKGTDKDVFHALKPNEFGLERVNSFHRQAVDRLAQGGNAVAVSADGVIEAVRFNKNVLGVQFHPERLNLTAVRTIYGEFANAVKHLRQSF